MKTILIAHNYSKKSFAAMSYHLAHFLAENGFRVIFISHRPYFEKKEIVKKEKGEIIILSWSNYKRPTGFRNIFHFSKIYWTYKPKIIIGHFVGTNISVFVSKFLSFFRVKTFVYYHTLSKQNLIDFTKNRLKLFLLKFRKNMFYYFFVDKLICPSALSCQDLLNTFWIKKKKVETVLNPIPDRLSKNKNLDDTSSILISYLGRLDESKNVPLLIKSFLKFQKEQSSSNIILQIAGGGSQEVEVKELCENSSSIKFYGKLEYNKVDNFLLNSHFSIIPSLYDNLPTVGLESLMNGTPILISINTGLSEYCTDDVDCYKFAPNEEQIIKLFHRVENIQEEVYKKMSINSRKLYMEKFHLSNYNKEIIKIIKE